MKIFFIVFMLLYQNHHIKCDTGSEPKYDSLSKFFGFLKAAYSVVKEKMREYFYVPPIKHDKKKLLENQKFVSKDQEPEKTFYYNPKCTYGEKFKKISYGSAEKIVEYMIKLREEPTALMTTRELAKSHGRDIVVHSVKTIDGYYLALHRVICSNDQDSSKQETVFLHHGLLGSSADWILLGKNSSLPYVLCEFGYDVWLANARGNRYSRRHETLSVSSDNFWNYTWQDIGMYDLPASIDYIRAKKGDTGRIHFIGHSIGATALLVLLSTFPIYNNYLRIGVLLAPLVLMSEVKGPLRVFESAELRAPDVVLDIFGKGEFLPDKRLPSFFVKAYCKKTKIFCNNPLYFLTGKMSRLSDYKDNSLLARLLYQVPAGGSTKTILHLAQIARNGKFHAYNDVQKEFPLKQVTLPIALFSSDDDWISLVSDVTRLYVNLVNPVEHVTLKEKNISHTEFVWGVRAYDYVFRKIIKLLEFLPKNVTSVNEV